MGQYMRDLRIFDESVNMSRQSEETKLSTSRYLYSGLKQCNISFACLSASVAGEEEEEDTYARVG